MCSQKNKRLDAAMYVIYNAQDDLVTKLEP